MDTENSTPEDIQSTTHQSSFAATAKQHSRLLSLVALISIVAGSIGGAFGSASLARMSAIQRLAGNTTGLSQRVTFTEDSAVIDVVKKASPAVVSIVITKDLSKVPGFGFNPFFDPFSPFVDNSQQQAQPNIRQVGAGSGFFVTSDGLVLTNRHVVEDEQASYTVVTSEGKTYNATVLARDPVNDLALVKVDIKNATTVELADSSKLEIGQRVIAIGNSLGQYQNTVTTGVVSGIGRSITAGSNVGSEQLEGVIQTDAAINPGNSGGPLLNSAGQVIGINTAIDQQGQLVGFAIPSNDASRAVASFQKSGKIIRPQLGIRYVIITEQLASEQNLPKNYGALVTSGGQVSTPAVLPNSAAARAGLADGDIVLEVNGQRIDEQHTLTKVLKDYQAGDSITLKVFKNNEEKNVQVTLGEAR
jgi:serine protease Do